jgi:ribonuclease HI
MKHIKKTIVGRNGFIIVGDSKKIIEEMNKNVISKETLEKWKEETKMFRKE